MIYISSIRFSEDNDGRPTYVLGLIAATLLTLDRLFSHFGSSIGNGLYLIALGFTGLTLIFGLDCLMGCIWHPIPKDRRNNGKLTVLSFNTEPVATEKPSETMFESLDSQTKSDDDELVGASEIEVRDSIQWLTLFLTLGVLSVVLFLIITR